jgi:hypothetical protein
LPDSIIWEAAAGDGRLVDPLGRAGRRVVATGLYPNRSDIERHNFLLGPLPPRIKGAVMITNPRHTRMTGSSCAG